MLWKRGKLEKRIGYEEMEKVRFISIFGGYLKIISQRIRIRLRFDLENISDFMLELKAALDGRGLGDRYKKRNYFRGLKIAVYSEQAFSRFKMYLWVSVLFITFNFILSRRLYILSGDADPDLLARALILIFYALLLYGAAEIILWRRIGKLADQAAFRCSKLEPDYQNKVVLGAFLGGELLYVGLLVLGLLVL